MLGYVHLLQIKRLLSDDSVLQVLHKTILSGWRESESDIPESIYAYFDFRDELTVQDRLVFKGEVVIVSAAIRWKIMAVAHVTSNHWHRGIYHESLGQHVLALHDNRVKETHFHV